MKTWAVSFDVVYDNFAKNEHWRQPIILIVKADEELEAFRKAKKKYLVSQCGETNTAKYCYYSLYPHTSTEIDLENID